MLQRHLHPTHPRVVRRSCCKPSSRPYVACIRREAASIRRSVDSSCRAGRYMSHLNITSKDLKYRDFRSLEVMFENPLKGDISANPCVQGLRGRIFSRQEKIWEKSSMRTLKVWKGVFQVYLSKRATICGFQCVADVSTCSLEWLSKELGIPDEPLRNKGNARLKLRPFMEALCVLPA